jgi:hypothetical protein
VTPDPLRRHSVDEVGGVTGSGFDVLAGASPSRIQPVDSDRRRMVDRMNPRLVNLLTALGFGLPVIGYLYLLGRYSVNIIVGDQWSDVPVIHQSYTHFFDWGSLWAAHNENRIFFPNIIVVILAHTVHYNIQVEEYLSAAMLAAATALLIWAHKRRAPSIPWIYYCPVAILTFSIVQWQNTLWGFQMAWYLVLLSLAFAIVLLDRATLNWITFVAAVIAGVVGSFSSLQGLLIWPAGLILIYHRRRAWQFAIAWISAGVAAVVVYFYHFGSPAGSYPSAALTHPVVAVKFYLLLIGDIVDVPINLGQHPNTAVLLFGLLIVAIAVVTALVYGIRRDEQGGSPVGVALICVGLLFAVTVTQGRIIFGFSGASQSRYTTFDLLILVGTYLTLLERPLRRHEATEPSLGTAEAGDLNSGQARMRGRMADWFHNSGLRVARWVVVAAIALQLALGVHYGLSGARSDHEYQAEAVKVLRNLNHTSDGSVQYFLDIFEPASWIRQQARVVEDHHLSIFGSGNPFNSS